MKRRQHRQRAAWLRTALAAQPCAREPVAAADTRIETQSAAGEEDPGAAVDSLVSPGHPVPGAGQAAPAPPDEAPPPA